MRAFRAYFVRTVLLIILMYSAPRNSPSLFLLLSTTRFCVTFRIQALVSYYTLAELMADESFAKMLPTYQTF